VDARRIETSAARPADVIDHLLGDALQGTRPERLVVFGLSAGLPQILTASGAARVIAADRSVVHARVAAEAARDLSHVTVTVSDGSSHLDDAGQASAVAIRVPREKQPGLQLIRDAYRLLAPGGRLYLAGANRDGIKSYLQHTGELFGGVHTLAMRKGCRVGVAVRDEEASPRTLPAAFTSELFDHECYRVVDAEVRGRHYTVHSRPGVFSWDRLDGGTVALVETMEVGVSDHVLDLGCGNGLVGAVASVLAAEGSVVMVDADIVAVESARRTAAANGRTNCEVRLGDGAESLADGAFDVVAVNPPFHLDRQNDYRTARRFIEDAARVLRPGGRLFLVANRFLPYEAYIRDTLGNVEQAFEDRSYKVLSAMKRAS
jgi:16S rRNA (guanine1207-N2)-methyltransferase